MVGPKNGTGFSIKDLRIEFKIEKSDSADPNKGTVKIYNLSNDTHEKVIVADNHITIKAGYQDETVASICFGDVLRGYRETDGMDRITVLEIYDARIAMMSGYVSVSYAKGTTASTVAQAFLDALGLAYKGLENIPAGEKYEEGFAFMGQVTDGLKVVLDRYGLSFTVQNEMVYIMAPGQPSETVGLEAAVCILASIAAGILAILTVYRFVERNPGATLDWKLFIPLFIPCVAFLVGALILLFFTTWTDIKELVSGAVALKKGS
jgi:hypothetical protein